MLPAQVDDTTLKSAALVPVKLGVARLPVVSPELRTVNRVVAAGVPTSTAVKVREPDVTSNDAPDRPEPVKISTDVPMVRLAVSSVACVGIKPMVTVQPASEATFTLQVLLCTVKSLALTPVIAGVVSEPDTSPVFCTVKVVELPALPTSTEPKLGEPDTTMKAAADKPEPVTVLDVLPMVNDAVSLPTSVGVKETVTVQEPPTPTAVQVELAVKSAAFVPVKAIVPNVPTLPPVLLTVKVNGVAALFTCTGLKEVLPPTIAHEAGNANPLPVNTSTLVPIVTEAVSPPTCVGVKPTVTEQVAPTATALQVLPVTLKSLAFVPATVGVASAPLTPPLFCTVKVIAGAAVPTYSSVKAVLPLRTLKPAGANAVLVNCSTEPPMVILADSTPAIVGVKPTVTVQVAPASTFAQPLLITLKSAALVPVKPPTAKEPDMPPKF